MKTIYLFAILAFLGNGLIHAQSAGSGYDDQYRPQIHFSPKEHWMNDPNGMVYHEGIYHLFFQYYPEGTTWGPMHWGHTTSADMIHWTEHPIAIYPDSLGYIFSGSAVLDKNNTSGFGRDGKAPLVAIYTSHNAEGKKAGANNYETQSIAYSLDNGKTWTKYEGNPVVHNPGFPNFRDPKVTWHEQSKKWIMTLAVANHIAFLSSPDLKEWTKESEFGENAGAHGGVWECPDLFYLDYNGSNKWVLIVNLNPGGPNKGSATQYFIGSFDGHTFTPDDTNTQWLDYGPDEYAGVTWSNTGGRKIFLGWMSNWSYANVVPTEKWRSAMTLPREIKLNKINDRFLIASSPVKELDNIARPISSLRNIDVRKRKINRKTIATPYRINIAADQIKDFSIVFLNEHNEKLIVGYDKSKNQYYIDRSEAGKSDFKEGFASKAWAPRLSSNPNMDLTIIMDAASIELFADDGLTTMTSIFFPKRLLGKVQIQSNEKFIIKSLQVDALQSIWK